MKNPREVCFLALKQREEKKHQKITEFFQKKKNLEGLSLQDQGLAKEICFGVERRRLSLEFLLHKILYPRKPDLLLGEKILLYMAIYQHVFMDKIPPYALVNETMILAKKYGRQKVLGFLHMFLRKLAAKKWELPKDNLSVFYSYPLFFIERLQEEYGEKAFDLLDIQNHFFPPMVRVKKSENMQGNLVWQGTYFSVVQPETLTHILEEKIGYIQNFTSVYLIENLVKNIKNPEKILDLCAAPGGKLLMLMEIFPKALFFANDVSEEKMQLLKENVEKYDQKAMFSIGRGEEFLSKEVFDLIVLDVPCSNSGVLHKRAEARWRLDQKQTLEDLKKLQFSILKNVFSFLSKEGQIWYMTCSILKEENEEIIEQALQELSLEIVSGPFKVLPDREGKDGGFACALQKKK